MRTVLYTATGLALIAAVFYFLTAAGIIHPGSLSSGGHSTILYIIGGLYFLGGFLVLLKKKWLWIIGLVANTIAIVVFYLFYNQKPDIMFSAPGLGTKIPQLFLEAALIYLIIKFKK